MTERIISIIAEVLERDPATISDDSRIEDFPEWDSMHNLMIISEIEEEFGIEFEPEKILEFKDIKSIIDEVSSKAK